MLFNVKTTVEKKIDLSRVEDLLICAFEGGSNYWYMIKRKVQPTEITHKSKVFNGEPYYLTPALNPGGALVIVDREENIETAKEFTLDLNSIKTGLEKMALEQPRHMENFLKENEDAETGDVFLQFCLFGEIVYG